MRRFFKLLGGISIIVLLVPPPISHYKRMKVHISIDDVYTCIDDLYTNTDKYATPFDQPLFYWLKKLHDLFGAEFTLYLYLYDSCENKLRVTTRYAKDFQENASWLKFGFHGIRPDFTIDESSSYEFFTEAYEEVTHIIYKMGGEQSNILRLHYWFATPEEKTFLSKNHVHTLLTSDKNKTSYSLSDNEMRFLHKEAYTDSAFYYLRTDLRLEEMDNSPYLTLIQHNDNDILVIFTHEWALQRWNMLKLARTIEILSLSKCIFIN